MYAASAAFIAAVRDGSSVRVLKLQTLAEADYSVTNEFTTQAIDGRVIVSDEREQRRRLVGLTIPNDGGIYTPRGLTTDVFQINGLLRVWDGAVLPDGTTEYAPLGTFRINRPWPSVKAGEEVLRIDGQDLWKQLMYSGLRQTVQYPAGASAYSMLVDLAFRAHIPFTALDDRTVSLFSLGSPAEGVRFGSNAKAANAFAALARDFGLDLYFTPLGVLVAAPVRNYTAESAVFAFNDTVATSESMEGGYEDSPDISNHVGVRSSSPSVAPVFAEAQDNNAASPTYVGGTFGDRYSELRYEWVTTLEQAASQAQREVRRQVARTRPFTISHYSYPWLDAQDVVTITSTSLGVSALQCVLASTEIGLRAGDKATTKVLEVRSID